MTGMALAIGGQHGVDDDAGDGDIEPYRIGPARKAAMRREATGEREKESNQDHGKADDGKKNVRCQQDPKIDEASDGIGPGEEQVAVQDVVDDVSDEEDARDDEGAEHAVSVCSDLAATDVTKAKDKEEGTKGIKDGGERGQEGQARSGDVNGRMIVDQPSEEERGNCTDSDDSGDD